MAVRCMPSADLDNDRKMDVVFDLSEIEWWRQAMIWTFRWFNQCLDYRILFTREWGFSFASCLFHEVPILEKEKLKKMDYIIILKLNVFALIQIENAVYFKKNFKKQI